MPSLNEHVVRAAELLDGAIASTGLTTQEDKRQKALRPVTVHLPLASALALSELIRAAETFTVAREELDNAVRKGTRSGGRLL